MVKEPLLVVIAGSTGSGKTALSLALAQQLSGEVVSCDSVAVYRGMELGTAKPSWAERAQVRHHMIDVVDPSQEYDAGAYSRAARVAIAEIHARGHVPIVAGGTGLYLRALLDGLSPVPQRDEALRGRLRSAVARRGPALLMRVLRRLDPAAAKTIHSNDLPKLIRAIEVSVLACGPMSGAWQHLQPEPLRGFRVVQLGLQPERASLVERINARCEAMFRDGLVEETRALVAAHGAECRALQALGYAEAQAVLRGELSEAGAIEKAQAGHRQYSKRQGTWFRRDPRIHWLQGFGGDVVRQAVAAIHIL